MPVVGPPQMQQHQGQYYAGGQGPGQYPPGYMGPPPQVSDHVESAKKRQDYEALCHIINQWNANRLDLFALSLPNEVRKVL